MYTDTEGIVFRQIKATGGRRIIVLLSAKYGKISAGTSIPEKGKNKASLATKPFTLGRYEIRKSQEFYHINGADAVRSYYKIGEDVEKFMYASYALEFTDKLLPEEAPAGRSLALIKDYFDGMERRNKAYDFYTLAYIVKAMAIWGVTPELNRCTVCGEEKDAVAFDIKEGGIVCRDCLEKTQENANETLISTLNFGIVNIMGYLIRQPLKDLEKLNLDEQVCSRLWEIMRRYAAYHLEIENLKSESFLKEESR